MLNEPIMLNCSCHLNGTGNDPTNLGVLFTHAVASPLLDTVILITAFPVTLASLGTIGMIAMGGLPAELIPFDDSIGSRTSKLMLSNPDPSWIVRFIESSLISGVARQSVRVLEFKGPVIVLDGKTESFGVRYFPLMVR